MKFGIEYNVENDGLDIDKFDITWNSLELTKEALIRLKEHYEWYINRFNDYDKKDKPQWLNIVTDEKYGRDLMLNLRMDNGEEKTIYIPYGDYHDSLISLKIIIIGDNLEVTF